MSDIAKHLGQRIREMRNARHMSQEELAFNSGISPAHLGQIERATKNPTIDTVAKIASALGVSVVSLFSNEPLIADSQGLIITKINAQLVSMDEESQKDILKIIRIFRNHQKRDF